MSYSVHHVPGRLRIRARRLHRDDARAQAAAHRVRHLPGVLSATANALTGSLTIAYDRAHTSGDALIRHLCLGGDLGRPPGPHAVPPPAHPPKQGCAGSATYSVSTEAEPAHPCLGSICAQTSRGLLGAERSWQPGTVPENADDLGPRLAALAVETIVQTVVQRSVVALIRALI